MAEHVDPAGALVARLKNDTQLATLSSSRIATERDDDWPMPAFAVLVEGPRGGPGELELGIVEERFDFKCYGPNEREARRFSDLVLQRLIPRGATRTPSGFVLAHTRVYSVRSEGGRIILHEPNVDWPYGLCALLVKYSGVRVP